MREYGDLVTREMLDDFRHEFVIASNHNENTRVYKILAGVFVAKTELIHYEVAYKNGCETFDKLDDALARYNEL
jgi:hypothetical protein